MNTPRTQSKQEMRLSNQKDIKSLLTQMTSEIERCLPAHLTPERMTRIAMTELRKTPKLQECTPMSFIAAIMQASQLGLEPGVLGSCYLIPFWNSKLKCYECTFMPGYRGYLDLARRSGQIKSLVARAVYENDVFDYEFGLHESITHKPTMEDKGAIIAVYAVAILKDGGHQFDVMSKKDIERVRQTSKSKDSGPWVEHYEEMAKKTVVRRLFKWLPCSVEMQKAVSLDELQGVGKQDIKAAASEEFNTDFIDAEPSPESNPLMDKIQSAKSGEETEVQPQTDEQAETIEMLLSVKQVSSEAIEEIKGQCNVVDLSGMDYHQAADFINYLQTCEDK